MALLGTIGNLVGISTAPEAEKARSFNGVKATPSVPTIPEASSDGNKFAISPTAAPITPAAPKSEIFGTGAAVPDAVTKAFSDAPDGALDPTKPAAAEAITSDISGGANTIQKAPAEALGPIPAVPEPEPAEALAEAPGVPAPAPAEAVAAVPGVPAPAPTEAMVKTDALPDASKIIEASAAEGKDTSVPSSSNSLSSNSVVHESGAVTPDSVLEIQRKMENEAAVKENIAQMPNAEADTPEEAKVISEGEMIARANGETLQNAKVLEDGALRPADTSGSNASSTPPEEKTLFGQNDDHPASGLPGAFGGDESSAPAVEPPKAEIGIIGQETSEPAKAETAQPNVDKMRRIHRKEVFDRSPFDFVELDENGEPFVDMKQVDLVVDEEYGPAPISFADYVKNHPKLEKQLQDNGLMSNTSGNDSQDGLAKAA